jgi:hypothetical protein
MTSFAKYVAVLSAGLIVIMAPGGKADPDKTPKPDAKEAPKKKDKKPKPDEAATPRKRTDVPVEKGHPAFVLRIPYFTPDGKRQMNFTIGVASRIDEDHIDMKDLKVETFDENEEHEMDIDLPTAIFNTETSVITSRQHVTIHRDDFDLTGECMIFNTLTKQGGLGGNVHMLIYNLDRGETDPSSTPETKEK